MGEDVHTLQYTLTDIPDLLDLFLHLHLAHSTLINLFVNTDTLSVLLTYFSTLHILISWSYIFILACYVLTSLPYISYSYILKYYNYFLATLLPYILLHFYLSHYTLHILFLHTSSITHIPNYIIHLYVSTLYILAYRFCFYVLAYYQYYLSTLQCQKHLFKCDNFHLPHF